MFENNTPTALKGCGVKRYRFSVTEVTVTGFFKIFFAVLKIPLTRTFDHSFDGIFVIDLLVLLRVTFGFYDIISRRPIGPVREIIKCPLSVRPSVHACVLSSRFYKSLSIS